MIKAAKSSLLCFVMILTDKNNSHWFEDCQIAINMGHIPTHTLTSTFFLKYA